MATTVEDDLDIAKAALRRIAGTNPVVEAGRRGPGGVAIVQSFQAIKSEAGKALDKLFIREFERESEAALAEADA